MAIHMTLEPTSIAQAVDGLSFRTQAFIDGRFVDVADGRTYASLNPATGELLAEVALSGTEDVDRAVAAARAQADGGVWSISPADRKRILIRFADLIDDHVDELALTESLDAGKPISDTLDARHPRDGRVHPLACRSHRQALRPGGADRSRHRGHRSSGSRSASWVPSSRGTIRPRWLRGSWDLPSRRGNSVVIKPASSDRR